MSSSNQQDYHPGFTITSTRAPPMQQPTYEQSPPKYQPKPKPATRNPYTMCKQYEDPVVFQECIKFYVDQNEQIQKGIVHKAPQTTQKPA